MLVNDSKPLCYLCGQLILDGQPVDRDHVPPRQVFPSSIRHGLSLLTLPVHRECHGTTGRDEEYFLQHVLFPLAHSTLTGQAAIPDFQAAIRRDAGWNKVQRVRTEFDALPSGLVLPNDRMVKHFDPEPVAQTIWKIARGLFFTDTERFLPKETPRAFQLFTEGEEDIPPLTVALMGEPSRGHSPEVFDYRIRLRDGPLVPHFMLMRFWERLIWQVAFRDPRDPPLGSSS